MIKEKLNTKNSRRNLIIFTSIFFIIHILLQLLTPIYVLGYGLQVFDNPDRSDAYSLELKSNLLLIFYYIISFPILFTIGNLNPFTMSLFGTLWHYTALLLNSLLWALIFYLIIKKIYFKNKI